MFACRVHVVSTHKYPTIWININPTCLLNGSKFLKPNMTHLLNGLVMSTCLLNVIKMKKKIMKTQTNKYFKYKIQN